MTKILFAVGVQCTPILATNDGAVKFDIEMNGADMDDHVASKDIMDLRPGLYLWTGERREKWFDGDLDIDMVATEVRPATQNDLDELGFPCPADVWNDPIVLESESPATTYQSRNMLDGILVNGEPIEKSGHPFARMLREAFKST